MLSTVLNAVDKGVRWGEKLHASMSNGNSAVIGHGAQHKQRSSVSKVMLPNGRSSNTNMAYLLDLSMHWNLLPVSVLELPNIAWRLLDLSEDSVFLGSHEQNSCES